MTLLYLLLLGLFLTYVGWLAGRLVTRSLTEWLLIVFLLGAGSVVLTGFVLSYFYLTGTTLAWAGSVFVTVTLLSEGLRRLSSRPIGVGSGLALLGQRRRTFGQWFGALPIFQKSLFGLLLGTVALLAVTNLLLVLFTVPNEWDSMTGHLNRVMQYIQRGSMRHFGGTNWNIDTYPKSVCTLQIYGFLMTGRFENGFKFIHHLAYWVSVTAVFGIGQRIGQLLKKPSLSASLLAALGFALLPDFLLQATTTETDIVLTSYLSVLLYMLFSYRASGSGTERDSRYLYLAGMAFGLAFGHKITFALLLPSVFTVMVYTVFWSSSFRITAMRTLRLGLAIALSMCLWTFPTGYLKNIEVFGHPIGPPTALKHQSVERAGSLKNLLKQGSRNVVRYAYDHLNLDGIRNIPAGAALNHSLRQPVVRLETMLHLDLDEVTNFCIQPFAFDRKFVFYNANPYWGILGFGLLLPLMVLVLLGVIRSAPHRTLAIALSLHFLALSFSAPYDPFKGRYFIETGLFGALFLTLFFQNNWLRIDKATPSWFGQIGRGYVGFIVGLGCVSAVMSVFLNTRALPFGWEGRPSAFGADRIQQMTVGRPDIFQPYHRFNELVPDTAIVALGTINDDYEYPLYGPNLSRRLITINPFEQGLTPIPAQAQYLFFDKSVICPQPGDIRLGTDTTMQNVVVRGEDYYLRKLISK